MSDVHLQYINDAYIRVKADPGILMELSEHLTYKAANYKFHPKYKARLWDGNISMVNRITGVVYAGLAKRIKKFCDREGYSVTFDDELYYDNVSRAEVEEHIASLNIPEEYVSRDYQIDSVVECLRARRRTLLSPTSSGKSFMIYLLHAWYAKKYDIKSLIIVPTTGLVDQFEGDLRDYGFTGKIHKSTKGLSKENDIDADIVITTWQSLNNGKTKMHKEWYKQFGAIFGDEAHGAKAACFINIMTNATNAPYRFGTTGTLGDEMLTQVTVEGLFGPTYQSTTTRELIDDGHATDLKIKAIVLRYPEDVRKEFNKKVIDPKTGKARKRTYKEEIDFINEYKKRTTFIKNLALSLEGNKLIFFRMRDHGDELYKAFDEASNVFYIDGTVKNREEIRKAMEEELNAILIASLGTTSTGVSIKRLHHMIAAAPLKAKIKLLQSIGRMLRQHDSKDEAYMYDIVDDLSWGNSKNYALLHFEERAKVYDAEQFEWKIYNVKL